MQQPQSREMQCISCSSYIDLFDTEDTIGLYPLFGHQMSGVDLHQSHYRADVIDHYHPVLWFRSPSHIVHLQ